MARGDLSGADTDASMGYGNDDIGRSGPDLPSGYNPSTGRGKTGISSLTDDQWDAIQKEYSAKGKKWGMIIGAIAPIPGGAILGAIFGSKIGKNKSYDQFVDEAWSEAKSKGLNISKDQVKTVVDKSINQGYIAEGDGGLVGNDAKVDEDLGIETDTASDLQTILAENYKVPGLTNDAGDQMTLGNLFKGRFESGKKAMDDMSDIEADWDEFERKYSGKIDEAESRYKENVASVPKLSVKAPSQFGGASIPLAPKNWMNYYGSDLDNLLRSAQAGAGISSTGIANRQNTLLNKYNIGQKTFGDPLAEIIDLIKQQKSIEGNLKQIEAGKEDKDLLGSLIPAFAYGVGSVLPW